MDLTLAKTFKKICLYRIIVQTLALYFYACIMQLYVIVIAEYVM